MALLLNKVTRSAGAKLNENTELMKIRSRVKNIDRMNLRFILLLHSTLVTVVQIKYALLPSLHHHHLNQVRKSASPELFPL